MRLKQPTLTKGRTTEILALRSWLLLPIGGVCVILLVLDRKWQRNQLDSSEWHARDILIRAGPSHDLWLSYGSKNSYRDIFHLGNGF